MPAKTTSRKPVTPRMPITGHLVEMRNRLFKGVAAVIIATALAFIFAEQIFNFLKAPAGDIDLIYIEMVEMLSTYFRVSLAAGVIIAMPYLVYQLFAFASPALTAKERRYIYWILPGATIMFLIGIAFAYYIALPPALNFLLTFGSDIASPEIRIGNYINIVTRLMMAIGFIFETPVIIMFMSRMGIITPQWLARRRKLWWVLSFVIAAIITPTFDPINQSIVALPLIILLEISIWLSKLVYKKKSGPAPSEV